jgi:DNA-binding SARP family transcriptional activator
MNFAAIVLSGISKLYSKTGAHAAAVGAARRLLAIEPYRQVGHRQLMRATADRRTEALLHYRHCENCCSSASCGPGALAKAGRWGGDNG